MSELSEFLALIIIGFGALMLFLAFIFGLISIFYSIDIDTKKYTEDAEKRKKLRNKLGHFAIAFIILGVACFVSVGTYYYFKEGGAGASTLTKSAVNSIVEEQKRVISNTAGRSVLTNTPTSSQNSPSSQKSLVSLTSSAYDTNNSKTSQKYD